MAKPNRTLPALYPKALHRFWSRVQVGGPDECWPWTFSRDRAGYGLFNYAKTTWRAHRVAYFIGHNTDPGELLACHSCDNPCCCNPAHLFLGTPADNLHDCQSKGRLNTAAGDRHRTKKHPELILRGEQVGGSKLSAAQVIEIRRRFAKGETQEHIASCFNVTRGTVKGITVGNRWMHVGGPVGKSSHSRQGSPGESHPNSVLTEAKVREMRLRRERGESKTALANAFGVSRGLVGSICKRRAWKHVV
jgi:hypothetical protein